MRGLRPTRFASVLRCRPLSVRVSESGPLRFSSTAAMGRDKAIPGEVGSGTEAETLPKLSPAEFRVYNRMAEHMEQFHNHFRLTWHQLQDACTGSGKGAGGLSPRQIIMTGLGFCAQLEMHHSIEEQHIFPILAKKMPEFREKVTLLQQHKQIHKGLDKLGDYLNDCRSGQCDLHREEIKKLMDEFGAVLWAHLDDEVHALRADNMRKYWTQEEMRRLPM